MSDVERIVNTNAERVQEHPLLGKDEITTILLLTNLPEAEGHDGT